MTLSFPRKAETMDTKLLKKALTFIFAVFLSWGFLPGPGGSAAAPKTFTDKLGYFSFTPPEGWTEMDYPGEKVGRVRFTSPDRQATLSLIVMPAPPQEATFEKLLAGKRLIVEKMRQETPEGKFGLKEDKICQHKCVRIEVEFPGTLIQENYIFLEGGLSVTFGYAASDRAGLEKYRKIALDSFCSIKLKK
jgi:hypothetical protein